MDLMKTIKLSAEERKGCSEELFAQLEAAAQLDITKSMVIIEFGYDAKYVMEYDDAMTLLGALAKAEKFDTSDWNKPCITPSNSKLEIQLLSRDEYHALKMRHLLNMNLQEPVEDGDGS